MPWEHFPHYWPFVWGSSGCLQISLTKGQWCEALMFSLVLAWISHWMNGWVADDLRCHGHVMSLQGIKRSLLGELQQQEEPITDKYYWCDTKNVYQTCVWAWIIATSIPIQCYCCQTLHQYHMTGNTFNFTVQSAVLWSDWWGKQQRNLTALYHRPLCSEFSWLAALTHIGGL